jgi:Tol biopolymer transport system component
MTMHGRRLDRLPQLFDELASASAPDYLEDAIERASSRPQRPEWTFPGRWLPVQITSQAVPAARLPWRQLGILAVIGLLLIAGVVAYAGSRRGPSPAPLYGTASNGAIAISSNGDINTVDHETGVLTPLITGPEFDTNPVYFRDGTRIAFQRQAGAGRWTIMTANADGSGIVAATREPLADLVGWSVSPAGDELLVSTQPLGRTQATVLAIDGSHPPIQLQLALSSDPHLYELPAWRPPDGREILAVGMPDGSQTQGVFVVDPATGKRVRTLVEPAAGEDIFGAQWSPTGDAVAYGRFGEEGIDFPYIRTRIVAADGSSDRTVDETDRINYNPAASEWSNDGTRIVVTHQDQTDGLSERVLIADVDGTARPVRLTCNVSGPEACAPQTNFGNIVWTWSPDDTLLLGNWQDTGIDMSFIADPETGQITPAAWNAAGPASWQRLAP